MGRSEELSCFPSCVAKIHNNSHSWAKDVFTKRNTADVSMDSGKRESEEKWFACLFHVRKHRMLEKRHVANRQSIPNDVITSPIHSFVPFTKCPFKTLPGFSFTLAMWEAEYLGCGNHSLSSRLDKVRKKAPDRIKSLIQQLKFCKLKDRRYFVQSCSQSRSRCAFPTTMWFQWKKEKTFFPPWSELHAKNGSSIF